MTDERRGLASFYALVSGIILLDQITKAVVLARFFSGESLPVIPSVFHLTLVHNRGIAFGLFGGFDRILIFTITGSIMILTVIGHRLWARSKAANSGAAAGKRQSPMRVLDRLALALILGGAVGNWIDRIRFGAVIDFLDFRIWPVFNLADSAITIGVGLYLIHFLKDARA